MFAVVNLFDEQNLCSPTISSFDPTTTNVSPFTEYSFCHMIHLWDIAF